MKINHMQFVKKPVYAAGCMSRLRKTLYAARQWAYKRSPMSVTSKAWARPYEHTYLQSLHQHAALHLLHLSPR